MIKNLVKKNIRRLKPYIAKEIRCRVKLDANESPYNLAHVLKSIENIETNRYPDPEAGDLKKALAKIWKVRDDTILHGNGSDELIYYLIATFGGPVMYPSPTFSMYGIISQVLNEKTVSVPLTKGFQLNREKMLRLIREKKPHLIFLSSPNNPTGNCFERNIMVEIIKKSKAIVVIDEAYLPFSSEQSFVKLIREYPNLFVMKTLSKIGLAALRSGFIIGRKEIIDEVNKVRLPFNVNALSQTVALAALRDFTVMNKFIEDVKKERNRLFVKLMDVPTVRPYPSEANFILFRVGDAKRVYRRLLNRGVLVRDISDAIKDCLRVTVGNPKENDVFISQLRKVVQT